MKTGIIFDIQRLSVNNGPGIRTTAFLKGCPLRCIWCHNPEAYSFVPQLKYMKNLCHFCGNCVRACKTGALTIKNGQLSYDEAMCKRCLACSIACSYGAMKYRGQRIDAEELVKMFLRDKEYYDASGGGITLSGGEPIAQYEFTCEILDLSKDAGLSTCVDTCGYCSDEAFASVLGKTDMMLFDIKHMDPVQHKKLTGVDNTQILKNLRALAESGKEFRIRYPMIPGYNDDDENISKMCELLLDLNVTSVDVSVFHDYYRAKYAQMFREEDTPQIQSYTQEEISERLKTISSHGVIPNQI